MILDIKPLLRGETDRIEVDYCLEPEELPFGVEFLDAIHAVGEITDNAGYMRLSLDITVPYKAECARCLEPIEDDFSETFERTVVARGTVDEDRLEECVDEYAVLDENGCLNVDEEILETVILLFPKKFLCEDDCPGLCPKCGKLLREGKCSCPEKEIDPRLSVLKKLLDNPEK